MTIEASTRLTRSLLIGGSMAVVTAIYQLDRAQASDFAQLWSAARAWIQGSDPYAAVGPGRSFEWPFPLLYPMPAVLAAVPLAALPLSLVDPLVVGGGFAVFSWVVMRERLEDPRLLMCLSNAGTYVVQTSQWAPWLCGAPFVPWLGPLLACKPTLGLALLAAYPSRRAAIGFAAFMALSVLAWPTWPFDWWTGLSTATHIGAPVQYPGGFLVLAALLRWRRPEARLLVVLACVPQTPQFYEAVPLFLIPRTWTESILLTALSYVAGAGYRLSGPFASYEAHMEAGGIWMVWFYYIPCTVFVLRHGRKRVGPTAS